MTLIIKSTAELEYKNELWRAEWVGYTFEGKETKDRWFGISKKEHGDFVRIDEDADDDAVLDAVKAAFVQMRIDEIHNEYGTPVTVEEKLEFSKKVLERSWDGDWMGQRSSWFYIDNLAQVLKTDFQEAARIVGLLEERKIVGLNGFIIIPWEEAEKTRQYLEDETGHKDLRRSDFGGWSCGHCFRNEDERGLVPSEVKCVEPDFIRKRRKS